VEFPPSCAEKELSAAVSEVEKAGINDIRLAECLNDLGNLYYTIGKLAEAEKTLKRALETEDKAGGKDLEASQP
jgi:tetratricopeptide (TPR) repeat protein